MKQCNYCGYEWDYKGISMYATCPRCRTTNKVSTKEEILLSEQAKNE